MLKKLKDLLTRKRLWPLVDVFIFIVITYGFHVLYWEYNYEISGFALFKDITSWLDASVYIASSWIDSHILGMDIVLYSKNIIHFNSNNGVIIIEESCSGFKQMCQVLVLFLLFPGPWKYKLWYIPMGLVSMFLINIVRIVCLSIVIIHWPHQWDFIHMWVLRPFYYLVIFILWVVWVEKFGGIQMYFKERQLK